MPPAPATRQVAAGGLAAVAVAYGLARYGYGLFVPEFRSAFGLSPAQIGAIASSAYAAYLAALLAAGVLAARRGPRLPVLIGGLAAAAGMGLIAASPTPWVLAVGAVLAGSSAGWSWAPFSDAVAVAQPPDRRRRALAIISTGTSVGLFAAAPIALAGGANWRIVWLAFAVCAATSVLYNHRILPAHPPATSTPGPPRLRPGWLRRPGAAAQFAIPLLVTVATSTYFTFAVDLLRTHHWPPTAGPLLWALIGAAGLSGLAGGDLAARLGLRRLASAALLALAGGIALLGLAPASPAALVASAVSYSAGYMLLYAALVICNGEVFADRPSAGWSATMLVIAAASIFGPTTTGTLATHLGLQSTFLLIAALPLLALAPARHLSPLPAQPTHP